MKRSAAEHRKPTRWDAVLAAGIIICALLLGFFLYRPGNGSTADTVTISQDGALLGTYRLSRFMEPVAVEVDGPYPLTVQLSAQGAKVIRYTCPNGDCAKSSLTAGTPGQLICLPNRTIITLTSDTTPEYDAVTR